MQDILSLFEHEKEFKVKVFAEGDCRGSWAAVFFCQTKLNSSQMQQKAQHSAAPATCFISLGKDSKELLISFFNATHEIAICGHGLLASAYSLQKILEQSTEHQASDLSQYQFVLSNHQKIKLKQQQGIWIAFSAVEINKTATPKWASQAFAGAPKSTSTVGDENGYYIFEWADDYQLQDLKPDFESILNNTQRGIIATQSSMDKEYDFNLRYFAPQHGVNEDPATGSAIRVLATYWQQKKCNNSKVTASNLATDSGLQQLSSSKLFKGRQLSEQGGVIYSQIEDGLVWISGDLKHLSERNE